MSISATCPSCSARTILKDDWAGRAAKCPQCGGILKVPALPEDDPPPARSRPSPPTMASPPSRPGGPPPPPPKKRIVDDEDDRPARWPKSRHDVDDLDHRTAKREKRRLDDDDGPPEKKKSKLPLILGICGGVLLLCCGGPSLGIYLLKEKINSALDLDRKNDKVVAENIDKLNVGMTQSQVEALLGPGKKMSPDDFTKMTTDGSNLTLNSINADHRRYWSAWVEKGLVYRWRNNTSYVLIAYNNPPESGGKLKGLSYQLPFANDPSSTLHNEKFPLPRYPPGDDDAVRLGIATKPNGVAINPIPPKADPVIPKVEPPKTSSPGDSKESAIRVKVQELLANPKNYERKWLTVSGTVADISLSPLGDGAYLLTANGMQDEQRNVRCIFGQKTFTQALGAVRTDEIDVMGRWYRGEPNEAVEILDCEVVNVRRIALSVTAVEITRDYSRDPVAADAKYKGKAIRITGNVLETKPQGPGDGITLRGLTDKKPSVKVSVPCNTSWKTRFEAKQLNEQAIVYGEVIGFIDGMLKMGDCWLLTR